MGFVLKKLLLGGALLMTSMDVVSGDWFYGVAAIASDKPYVDMKRDNHFIPFIGYKGEKFQFTGNQAKYSFANVGETKVNAFVSMGFGGFESKDGGAFEGLSERKSSIDAGVETSYSIDNIQLKGSLAHDLLGRYRGYKASASIGYQIKGAAPFFITPSLEVNHLSSDYVDYYYGVRASEATVFRAAYTPGASLSYTVKVSVFTPVLFGGITTLQIAKTSYSDEVSDSPIIAGNSETSVLLLFSKKI